VTLDDSVSEADAKFAAEKSSKEFRLRGFLSTFSNVRSTLIECSTRRRKDHWERRKLARNW
jgi:hypothetical protein